MLIQVLSFLDAYLCAHSAEEIALLVRRHGPDVMGQLSRESWAKLLDVAGYVLLDLGGEKETKEDCAEHQMS